MARQGIICYKIRNYPDTPFENKTSRLASAGITWFLHTEAVTFRFQDVRPYYFVSSRSHRGFGRYQVGHRRSSGSSRKVCALYL